MTNKADRELAGCKPKFPHVSAEWRMSVHCFIGVLAANLHVQHFVAIEKTLPGRLELPTLRLTASRSNQLSYGSMVASPYEERGKQGKLPNNTGGRKTGDE